MLHVSGSQSRHFDGAAILVSCLETISCNISQTPWIRFSPEVLECRLPPYQEDMCGIFGRKYIVDFVD